MKLGQNIASLLDTDLYKFTMQQVVFHRFPNLWVKYRFKLRNDGIDLSPYADEIRKQINSFCELSITDAELAYLNNIPFLKTDYVKSLKELRLDPACVTIATDPFTITIEGYWYRTILFEVPVLAIINEVYFRESRTPQERSADYDEALWRIGEKLNWLVQAVPEDVEFNLVEFGTRRRRSVVLQNWIVPHFREMLKGYDNIHFLGTSNVMLAAMHGVKAHGTMAHEYLQAFQALAPLHKFQAEALRAWQDEYKGDLGMALTDVTGVENFLLDFHRGFAMQYSGVRHDSGDPFDWGEKMIAHYTNLGIDPRTKTLMFTDSLDFEKAVELAKHFNGQARTAFGIGTYLTNDTLTPPLNVVIKMVECDGMPVAKISDSNGKGMCEDAAFLAHLHGVIMRRAQRKG
jgi:nicotinate phosphoribosyltransferase